MGSAGFKEWALVCEALGRGEQSIILRKGGIAEGRDGFAFRSNEFFLLPTFFHEQVEKVRGNADALPAERSGEVEIKFFARLEFAQFVTHWETVLALEPFHIWEREVVRDRFEYNGANGIHVAFVRIFRLEPSWTFPTEPQFGGCTSWVPLPDLPNETTFIPVLDDAEHEYRRLQVSAIISADAAATLGSTGC